MMPISRKYLNPKELPDWSHMFSQIVVVDHAGLRHVHVAGQVGVDAQKRLVGDRLEMQVDRAFKNVELALTAAGAAWSDVVKLTVFVVDYQPTQAPLITGAIGSRFRASHLPALSLVDVAALADPKWLVEVEATAAVQTEPAKVSRRVARPALEVVSSAEGGGP